MRAALNRCSWEAICVSADRALLLCVSGNKCTLERGTADEREKKATNMPTIRKLITLQLMVFWLLLSSVLASSENTRQPSREHGFSYFHDEVRDVPWSIHVLKVDRTRTELEFHTTLGRGANLGMGLVSDQARSFPSSLGKAVAAINGDFYRNSGHYAGDPEGLQIMDGELV